MDSLPWAFVIILTVLAAGTGATTAMGAAALQMTTLDDAEGLERLKSRSAQRSARLVRGRRAIRPVAWAVVTFCQIMLAVLVTLMISALLDSWWAVLVIGLVAGALVAGGLVEMFSTMLARRHRLVCLRAASGMLTFFAALSGHRLREEHEEDEHELTEDQELRQLVERVSSTPGIEGEDREMLTSIVELGSTIVREVMVPRTQMITIESTEPLRRAMSLFVRSGHSRVPVIGSSSDDVLGVAYLKDAALALQLGEESRMEPVTSVMRSAMFFPESKPVDDALRHMQSSRSHFAMVVDEYGGIAGLVTMEDILEEIVGELVDEHDPDLPSVEEVSPGRFRIPATLSLGDLGDLFGETITDDDVDTAGGLLSKAIGRVPIVGARAQVANIEMEAERVEGRRKQLSTLLVRHVEEPENGNE